MKFDMFYEFQKAKPWPQEHERLVIEESIAQARVADEVGFEIWWQVEHHATPEFSYSAAPEILLTAVALNTKRMHLGHAGVLVPFKINHPLRVAERIATMDILSGGRMELGLAKSGGKEWETFGVNPQTAREEVREAAQMIPKMWTDEVFSWNSDLLTIPPREVTPRPLQRPHPRIWQTAGSPDSFRMAGELGLGVLGTTLLSSVKQMRALLDEYEAGLADAKPAGKFVTNQKGIFTFVHVAESRKKSIESGAAWSALWYVNAAATALKVPRRVWYDTIRSGLHPNSPGDTAALTGADPTKLEIEPNDPPVVVTLKRMAMGETISYEEAHEVLEPLDSVIVGDVDFCASKFSNYEAIGSDRMMCLMQYGTIAHADVLRSIELTGRHLIPAFSVATDRKRA